MADKKNPSQSVNTVYTSYLSNCRRKNIFWELTREELWELCQKNCHYCDKSPSNHRRGVTYSGLDRIDHTKGYSLKNVIPCCKECNGLRSDKLTVEEMEVVAKSLKVFRLRKAD